MGPRIREDNGKKRRCLVTLVGSVSTFARTTGVPELRGGRVPTRDAPTGELGVAMRDGRFANRLYGWAKMGPRIREDKGGEAGL